jgi:hypothetical protein
MLKMETKVTAMKLMGFNLYLDHKSELLTPINYIFNPKNN